MIRHNLASLSVTYKSQVISIDISPFIVTNCLFRLLMMNAIMRPFFSKFDVVRTKREITKPNWAIHAAISRWLQSKVVSLQSKVVSLQILSQFATSRKVRYMHEIALCV